MDDGTLGANSSTNGSSCLSLCFTCCPNHCTSGVSPKRKTERAGFAGVLLPSEVVDAYRVVYPLGRQVVKVKLPAHPRRVDAPPPSGALELHVELPHLNQCDSINAI